MPIIKTYEYEDATGELTKLYDEIINARGSIGNNAKLFSSSPEILKHQLDFIKYYMNHKTLSMQFLAALRILVSTSQKCDFCIDFNTAILVNMAQWSLEDVKAMKDDIYKAKLAKEEIELLGFVLNSIKNPHNTAKSDVLRLNELGWEDKDILDALNHGARMLATDIIFNTFKIENYNG